MRVIDFHNHYYPPAYLDALRSGPSTVQVTIDAEGNPCLHYPGDYNVAVPGHRDIDYRERVLIEHHVDTQVITLTTPGTHVETPDAAVRLARLVNDAFAEVIASEERPLHGARDFAVERSPRFRHRIRARHPPARPPRRDAVQQREWRRPGRSALLAVV